MRKFVLAALIGTVEIGCLTLPTAVGLAISLPFGRLDDHAFGLAVELAAN